MTPMQSINWKGTKVVVEWIRTDSLEGLTPITQVYGICFNGENEILISRKVGDKHWIIPGGHPEGVETIDATLKREMVEEVDVEVKNIKLVGAQRVYLAGKPAEYFYQVRCVCEVEEILPQTLDPDNGKSWERKFVPAEKVTEYVRWGVTGNAMFGDAIELYQTKFSDSSLLR